MAWLDTEVIRDGKWVSSAGIDTIPGEACIDTYDGHGYYEHRLSTIPHKDVHFIISDTATTTEKEVAFNKALVEQNLPPYYNIKKGEE